MARPATLFDFTTARPVGVTMMVLAVVVFGVVGLRRLPVNLLPDITYPTVTVRTGYPGSSPEDVEERISERVQEAVAVVPGVRRVVSISRPGVSDVILEFTWGTEMVFAISDIRERLERVLLPREAERPLVLRYDPSLDPVLTIGLFGDLPTVDLRRIAEEEVERELAKVEGVAAVKVRGGDEEEIRIVLDEGALTVLGLDVATIGQRLAAENLNAASGSIEEGKTEFLVRTLGEFRNLEEIADVIVERRSETPIRLRDVARVVRVPKDREVISRVAGSPCVLVDVQKEAGANVVQLCNRVRDRLLGTAEQRAFVAERAAAGEAAHGAANGADGGAPADPGADWQRRARERAMTAFLAHRLEPLGVQAAILQDQSTFIETAIADVRDSAIQGGLLAIVVIFLFLRRLAPTVILSISIPVSLIASFAPMFLSDITLNVMSLGGLALGVGMLVDNSIVVLEAITREREAGRGLAAAAVEGVRRVAGAVTASTLTTVAVFFPIVFVEGIAGQLFRDQSLTVVYSLAMSLLVALFVIPMLASRGARQRLTERPPEPLPPRAPARTALGRALRAVVGAVAWLCGFVVAAFYAPFFLLSLVLDDGRRTRLARGPAGRPAQAGAAALLTLTLTAARVFGRGLGALVRPICWGFDKAYGALDRAYPRAVHGVLRARPLVVLLCLALLTVAGLGARRLGTEMLPDVSQGELWVEIFLPRDATVERTDAVVAPLERRIAELPGVAATFLAVGVDKEELNSSEEGEHSARILVRLEPADDLARAEEALRREVRELLYRTPEIESYRFSRPSILAFDAPLVVEVVGRDLVDLRETAQRVEQALREVPGLRDVRSTMQRGNPEIVLRLDRDKMSALGIDSGTASRILATKVQGDVPTRFSERDRKIDMRVLMAREELDRVQRLLAINVNPLGFPAIPLASVADVRRIEGPSEIRRIGNTRGAEVQAALQGFDLGSTQARVEAVIAGIPKPPGIDVRMGAQKEEMARSMDSVVLALALAIFLVYVVMASQFESLIQPFVILVSVPLAFVGVVFTLLALDVAVSVVVMLGGIVLAGIVVNNAIIMVDQINRLRREGLAKTAAIVEGAHSRLRPVLMTTATTVLGLLPLTGWLHGLPLIGGQSEGLELRAPLAITVVSGLTASTLLTLLVIPVVYSLMTRRD